MHFGENFLEPPDLALDDFRALTWLRNATGTELARRVDLPCCRADLYHLLKLALALERDDARGRADEACAVAPPR